MYGHLNHGIYCTSQLFFNWPGLPTTYLEDCNFPVFSVVTSIVGIQYILVHTYVNVCMALMSNGARSSSLKNPLAITNSTEKGCARLPCQHLQNPGFQSTSG